MILICSNQVTLSLLHITDAIRVDGEHCLPLRQTRAVVDLADPLLPATLPQIQPDGIGILITVCRICRKTAKQKHLEFKKNYLVVDACAIMFPPMGFLGSALNIAAPSTCATTWLVKTTATPNSSASFSKDRRNWARCIWMKTNFRLGNQQRRLLVSTCLAESSPLPL